MTQSPSRPPPPPNICQLYDGGLDYLVMEFVEGVPVSPPDSPRKLLEIAVQMSEDLAAAPAAGIVHRHLKPDNILITREGRVKLLDFGLAKTALPKIGPDDAPVAAAAMLTDPAVLKFRLSKNSRPLVAQEPCSLSLYRGTCVPEISRYAGQKALIAIDTLAILRGSLSPRTLALVTECAALHRAELLEDWALAREEAQLKPIAPLE